MPITRRAAKDTVPTPDPARSTPFTLSRLPEVRTRVSLSRSAIYTGIAEGWFPQPIKLGRAVAWVDSEIDAFIEQRMQARKAS